MTVSASESYPTRHASLSDGSTTIEFMLYPNERSFRAAPYPRTALKTTQGESKYSDLEPPYFAIAQDDFTGGRGNEDFESDTSRYFDGHRVDTSKESGVVLGGLESYSTGYQNAESSMPGDASATIALTGTTLYVGAKFTASASYTTYRCEIWVERRGDPGTLNCELWSDTAGEPNAKLAEKSIAADSVTTDENVPTLVEFVWTGSPNITSGTDYWVIVYDSGSPDSSNYWQPHGFDNGGSTPARRSANGSVWIPYAEEIYFRITPATAEFNGLFFEYKSALYMVTQPYSGGNSALYINGDRGAADDNSGDKTNLEDGTKSWTNDEWIGCVVLLTAGPGSEEEQPWRTIVDNDSNSLVCDVDWNVTHTTATEYVILKSDKWTAIDADLDLYVTDVAVAGDYIYMAHGGADSDNGISRYRYYNADGTWTAEAEADDTLEVADKLLSIFHTSEGNRLYGTTTDHDLLGLGIYKGNVPREAISAGADKHLFYPVYEFNTDVPWVDTDYTNADSVVVSGNTKITIAAGHTTGVAASMNIDALDLREGDALVAEVYSDVALDANDFQWIYDDVEDLVENNAASSVMHNVDFDGANTFTVLTSAYDGKNTSATDTAVSIAADSLLLIGYSKPFNKATFNIGSTPNAEVKTFTCSYYNGKDFVGVTGFSDGTLDGGATLAVDGTMSWTMPTDWKPVTINSVNAYWVYLFPSGALTASVNILEIYVTRQNNATANIPAVAIDTWTTVFCNIDDDTGVPDVSSIKSIGLNVAKDKGATNFFIRKLWLARQHPSDYIDTAAFRMPSDNRITGLQAYAGNVDDPILNPWIFTTDAVYELQTQNSDQIVQIPLQELAALSSPENGLAHVVNGTYLFFNIGEKIERYFNRTLDDIGPDRDEGLPDDRPGIPKSLASYPGRVYASIDANDGTSSVLALDGSAWHEVYRAPRAGDRIKSIYVQAIPGTNVDRLWISMGPDVLWLPISLSPYTEADFTYTFAGQLETSWIYANMLDVVKLWKSLKVFGENYGSTNRWIGADYKVDNDTTWTKIGEFDVSPVEEIDIASTLPQAKRIKFRFRFQSYDSTNSPRLKAYVVEGVAFVPVKYQYAMSIKLSQDEDNIDLDGVHDSTLDADAQFDKLVAWANAGDPLTLRHKSDLYDDKTVFIDPVSIQPMNVVNDETGKIEDHVAQLTCIEV